MDAREIFELIELVCAKNIAEIELEREGFRLRIVNPASAPARVVEVHSSVPVAVEHVAGAARAEQPPAEVDDGLFVVKSPIVGTFYRAPSANADPYVKEDDRVKKGQVLCIVEAMKLMNEIECEIGGVIMDVLVENGQPVEFGEPIFKIRPDK